MRSILTAFAAAAMLLVSCRAAEDYATAAAYDVTQNGRMIGQVTVITDLNSNPKEPAYQFCFGEPIAGGNGGQGGQKDQGGKHSNGGKHSKRQQQPAGPTWSIERVEKDHNEKVVIATGAPFGYCYPGNWDPNQPQRQALSELEANFPRFHYRLIFEGKSYVLGNFKFYK
ncbi:uncharacterized protein PFL1_00266 [Pseudozyma flocculosa PF-1]|uniref:Uncharacterized protein n=1 Tax=Pseudozyma flocculosa TaxID=84751 RepID=A0A5C3ERR6_9BASI|nr:uncharacterized protein PFL1_00266 [Pseudozyma flocculosa PF-1]EPQ32068.1 hypothetical protein PFL1_00266 [Pseudozyma flocculosa PF-1]SPO35003.1 uncharacterized protein PSFLO_00474 [Pseudozyma flocculosa]